jgi:hypothetical protein
MRIITIEIFDASDFCKTVERRAFVGHGGNQSRLTMEADTWASNRCDYLKSIATDDWVLYDYNSITYEDESIDQII